MTAAEFHELVSSAPSFAAAQDIIETAVAAGVTGAELLDAATEADHYYRCARCGTAYSVMTCDPFDGCDDCGGTLVFSTVDRPSNFIELGARTPRELGTCPRCGQTMIAHDTVCETCREADRAPQGEAIQLFETPRAIPAPQPEGLF